MARIRAYTRSLMTRVTADGETRGLVLAPSIAVTARVNHTLLVLKLNIMSLLSISLNLLTINLRPNLVLELSSVS